MAMFELAKIVCNEGQIRIKAQQRAGRRDRRRTGVAPAGHQKAVKLHQGAKPARRGQQARYQRRHQAAAGVRQAAGDDV